MRRSAVAAVLVSFLLLSPGCARDDSPATSTPAAGTPAAGPGQEVALTLADPAEAELLAVALEHARRENQRVLVQWGSESVDASATLEGLFADNRDVARKLLYEYQVVPVEVGDTDEDADLLGRYDGAPDRLPHLSVLDAAGKAVANRDGASLMAGDEYDAEAILGFLEEHQADYWQAGDILAAALAEAQRTERMVFLHTGAPW